MSHTWKTKACVAAVALIACVALSASTKRVDVPASAKQREWQPISVGAFADSIHHARMEYAHEEPPYERYRPDQIVHIAENLLAWQNGDGGWPKNIDWLKVFPAEKLEQLPHGRPGHTGRRSTLDNRTTWSQIGYLARVYRRTGLERYAASARKGIDYLLRTQHSSGGWRGADVDAITFNDDVMTGVLRTLKAVVQDRDLYNFVGEERRAKAEGAYERGLDCVLRCQITVDGRLTAWCQQHSHETYEPVPARSFEPAAITARESVRVVRLLMSIDDPSPEIVRAVQAAGAWFDRVKIEGLRVEKVEAEPVSFKYHWTDFDRVEVEDPNAPPIWTRFYDLETEEPIFCRAGKVIREYTKLSRERRTGYAWYGHWPAKLLEEDYPRWQRRWAPGRNVLSPPSGAPAGSSAGS